MESINHIIFETTRQQNVFYKSDYSKKRKNLTRLIYKCNEDVKTCRHDRVYKKESYIKTFNSDSVHFHFQKGYNFVKVELIHKKNHPTPIIVSTPERLEEFIKHQTGNKWSDICNAVKNSARFNNYIYQASFKPRRDISALWYKYFASR